MGMRWAAPLPPRWIVDQAAIWCSNRVILEHLRGSALCCEWPAGRQPKHSVWCVCGCVCVCVCVCVCARVLWGMRECQRAGKVDCKPIASIMHGARIQSWSKVWSTWGVAARGSSPSSDWIRLNGSEARGVQSLATVCMRMQPRPPRQRGPQQSIQITSSS